MLMMAATTLSSSGRLSIKLLSILRLSTGSAFIFCSWLRLEYPMPKSSSAMRTPASRRGRRMAMAASVSSIRWLSVISRISVPGAMA
uniref:Uncharacterized protein n=1 Tax=Cronobacter sakazakii TaxID=28141 RepID=A4H2R8_CROSK|nr:hypothetical protein [Cronobacter sakazakii]